MLLKYLDKKFQERIKKMENEASQATNSDISTSTFNSLSPVGDADPQGEYAKALKWALKNRKKSDIKNIALTGPYGSGKSSILKTFQAHNDDGDLAFLNISLATFKEETENADSPKGADLLRLIELSILQQIFYHEEDHKIPDSRFKKIKSFKKRQLWMLSIGFFLLAIATTHLIDKTLFERLIGFKASDLVKLILTLCCLAVSMVGYFYIIFKSIRTISSITINKLNIKDAEIAISDNISKSILNNHIDEILYFFEVTDYTVVVIEDLDRFEQTEIFTKLRELNLLINYSDKIKRDIVFIYAVRDDMFKDKDRTKFFDFIIPVIPVINSSNSNEKLMEIVNKNKYNIKHELIENISLFIDDMRLLYNITNEYYIYHKKLGKLDQNKLLSMIVYKNIYPNDFVDLSNGEGKLFSVFNKKDIFIKEKLAAVDDQILQIQQELKSLDALIVTDVHELRMIYVYKYIEKLSNISNFIMNDTTYEFTEVTAGELFKYLIEDKASYNFHVNNYGNNYTRTSGSVGLKFESIENEVNPNQTYAERLKLIEEWNSRKQDDLKTELAALDIKKNKTKHFRIKEIITMGGCKMELDNKKQLQLVNILLRNGYIDEDYLDYISIFYEGSITKEDREFLLNVKAQIASDHDYKLNKLDKLIPKIDAIDFTQHYILNHNLLDFLFSKTTYKSQRAAILNILKDESKVSIEFIDGFIKTSAQLGIFIKELTNVWPNIWHYLSQQSNYPTERLKVYFKLILQHAEVNDIKFVAEKSKLATEISCMTDFLCVDIDKEKLKQIIKTLNIKFIKQDLASAPEELALYVYNNNHYVLNEEMVKTVMKQFGSYNDDDFRKRNFYAVSKSDCSDLIKYINHQIDGYVSELYLSITDNTKEEEDSLVDLLNHEKLSQENKEAIIDQVETKIIDMESIELLEVAKYLLSASKLVPKWPNLIYYYHEIEDSFDDNIVGFINMEDNAKTLSTIKIKTDNPVPDLPTVKKFIRELLLEESISNASYQLSLKSVPYYYDSLPFQTLSKEKAKMLIENDKLGISVANYNLLRSDFSDLHIMLAEKKHDTFIPKIAEYLVEEPEVFGLLNSVLLTTIEKNVVIAHADETVLAGSTRVSTLIGKLLIADDQLVVSKSLILHILLNSLASAQRLELLVKKFGLLTKEEVFSVLVTLPDPYPDITISGKRPTIEGYPLNSELVARLVRAGHIKRGTEVDGKIKISTFRQ